MGNVRINFDQKWLDKTAKQAVDEYAKQHSHECAYCHKPIEPTAGMPADALPVCADCAKARGLV